MFSYFMPLRDICMLNYDRVVDGVPWSLQGRDRERGLANPSFFHMHGYSCSYDVKLCWHLNNCLISMAGTFFGGDDAHLLFAFQYAKFCVLHS